MFAKGLSIGLMIGCVVGIIIVEYWYHLTLKINADWEDRTNEILDWYVDRLKYVEDRLHTERSKRIESQNQTGKRVSDKASIPVDWSIINRDGSIRHTDVTDRTSCEPLEWPARGWYSGGDGDGDRVSFDFDTAGGLVVDFGDNRRASGSSDRGGADPRT